MAKSGRVLAEFARALSSRTDAEIAQIETNLRNIATSKNKVMHLVIQFIGVFA